jgi:outer membrane protein assembly factor BamB
MDAVRRYLEGGDPKSPPAPLWTAGWARGSDTVSVVVAANAVVTVSEVTRPRSLATEWWVRCLGPDDGRLLWEQRLPGTAATGGLCIDREGRIVVVLEDGRVVAFGAAKA